MVRYKADWGDGENPLLLKEAYLINKILKENSVDGKCTVELITCDQKTFEYHFG